MGTPDNHSQSGINRVITQIRSSERVMDLICLVLLAALNPLTYTMFADSAYSQPDTFAYISQAIQFLENGRLHTGPYGHVDTALILPPLFPCLISFLMLFDVEGLIAAVKISQASGILFSFLAYLLIKDITGKVAALLTIAALQVTFFYFNLFSTPLTEAVFLLMLLMGFNILLSSLGITGKKSLVYLFVCGIACALVFFSREIGLAFLVFSFIFILIHEYFRSASTSDKKPLMKAGMLVLGFSVLVIPYFTVIYLQTSQPPLTREFRLGHYSVSLEDEALIEKIKRIRNTGPGSYEEARERRRELMQLLPGGREMLNHVRYAGINDHDPAISYDRISSEISGYPGRLRGNMTILYYQMGPVIFGIFIILFVVCIISFHHHRDWPRLLLPSFMVIYLLILSVFTDLVGRYLVVLLPLILIFMYVEATSQCRAYLVRYPKISKNLSAIVAPLVLTLILIFFSGFFTGAKVYFPVDDINEGVRTMRTEVNGEPVFTNFPFYAYSVGGKFRLLPNDELKKIIQYGEYTGVRWLLLVETSNVRDQMAEQYWNKASQWVNSDLRDSEYLAFCCAWYDLSRGMAWRLFKLIHHE